MNEFVHMYGVEPPQHIIKEAVEELVMLILYYEDHPEEEWLKWLNDDSVVLRRLTLKLRVKMINAGYFPGTCNDNFEELTGEFTRSRMFHTPHFWKPINQQADGITDFSKLSYQQEPLHN